MSKRTSLEQQQRAFTACLRAPDKAPFLVDVEPDRIRLYHELLYNNIEGFLRNGFPVLHRLCSETLWHQMVGDFFERHRCRSPLFRDIAREFIDYLEQGADLPPEVPRFVVELAHYEWVESELFMAEDEVPPALNPACDVLNGRPAVSALAWLLAYKYPVHRIGPDFQPAEPPEQETYLMVYRDRTDTVRFLELNAVSARLFELLKANPAWSGRQVLEQIARELGCSDPEPIVLSGQEELESWLVRGILLGAHLE